jgi:hypothetical protein
MFDISDLQTKNRTRHTENRTPRTPTSVYLSFGTKKIPAIPDTNDMTSETIEIVLSATHLLSFLILLFWAFALVLDVIVNSTLCLPVLKCLYCRFVIK